MAAAKDKKTENPQASADVVAIDQASERCAGSDDGHYGIKLVTESETGQLIQLFVASRVAEGAQLIALNEEESNLYEVEGGATFTVSDTLPHVDTRFKDYAVSSINRVLNHHAMIQAGLSGKNVRVVTGLPIADFFSGSEPNHEFINRKIANLLDQQVINRNESVKCANIVGHSVQAEAIAAYYDLLINEDGSINEEIKELVEAGSIAFIDIGGKTTDFAVVVNNGSNIDPARSGTSDLGAISLTQAVERALKTHFKVDQVTPRQVDNAVMTGNFRVFGKDNDCAALVDREKTLLAEQIVTATKRKMRDAADIERVFFVGGGSILLREQLKHLYPHAVFVEDPQFSNARGMWKIAKYMMN